MVAAVATDEQDEQRQLQQHGLVHRPEIDHHQRIGAGPAEIERSADEAYAEHHGGDVQAECHRPQEEDEADGDGGDVDHVRLASLASASPAWAISEEISSSSDCGP